MRGLRDHYLRLDARSLGLFRVLFAAVLLADLIRRWRWLSAFYVNTGVLPNYAHLTNLGEAGHVWSLFHAISLPGEAHVAFAVILGVYTGFLLGWHTRAFHLLSLVALVSLSARNVLLENAGDYAAIALLAFTAFLPTGRRLSLDALTSSLAARDEKHAVDLNDRASPTDEATAPGDHGRGWSPASIAALAVLLQLGAIYLCAALQQTGPAWRDGTALHYALHLEPWVSRLGASVRGSSGLVRALSFLIYGAEWAIPALLFAPFARQKLRWLAILLVIAHALTLGLLLDLGLYAWTLLAAAPLLVTGEMWADAALRGRRTGARLTVIYDADCGICLWVTRVLKRLDAFERLTFQGNDDVAPLPAEGEGEAPANEVLRRVADGALERAPMPKGVTPELVDSSVVVVDANGRIFARGRAVTAVVAALPLGRAPAAILRSPGVAQLLDRAYDFVAKRRVSLSVLAGMSECGIPVPDEQPLERAAIAPATRALFIVTGGLRELGAALVLAAMLAQTSRANALPGHLHLPQGRILSAIAEWPRMLARWDVLSPEPPRIDGAYVIDGDTKSGRSVDPISSREPVLELEAMRGTGLGQLWADYLDRVRRKEWAAYQGSFRDYLGRGGVLFADPAPPDPVVGLDAYWLSAPIAPPGEEEPAPTTKEKLFSHGRGGKQGGPAPGPRLPGIRPGLPGN